MGVITSAPAPYRVGLFERLARRDDLDMTVYFLGRTCGPWTWDDDLEGDFPHQYLDLASWAPKERYSMWVHPQVSDILKEKAFDAVVVGGYFIPTFILAIRWCRNSGTPYLLWTESHGGMQRSAIRKILRPLIVDPLIKGASAHLAVSSLAKDYLVESGAERDGIFLVLNSPDVEGLSEEVKRLRPRRDALRKELGLGDGPVALFMGRMTPDKGVDDLLDAYGKLYAKGRAGTLLMAGRGELLEPTRARISREGWKDVHAVGFVPPEDLPRYYAASDFLVLPSRHEPFGAVVQEALAAGIPALVSDAVGAAEDLVDEGKTGFAVPSSDVEALSAKMAALWEDRVLRENMVKNCVEKALQFGHGHGEEQFMNAVRWAMKRDGGSGS